AVRRMRAAAVSHLRADGVLPARRPRWRRKSADPESARHRGLHQGIDEVSDQQFPCGQHTLQRADAASRFQEDRFLETEDLERRQHGWADDGCQSVESYTRLT